MSAGGHVALDGFGLRGVDDGVEEVGFAVLTAEILQRGTQRLIAVFELAKWQWCWSRGSVGVCVEEKRVQGGLEWKRAETYTADDSIVACEMGLAVLASEDLVGV